MTIIAGIIGMAVQCWAIAPMEHGRLYRRLGKGIVDRLELGDGSRFRVGCLGACNRDITLELHGNALCTKEAMLGSTPKGKIFLLVIKGKVQR